MCFSIRDNKIMYFVLEGRTGPRFLFDTSEIMSMIAVSLRHLNIMHDRILSGQEKKKRMTLNEEKTILRHH